MPEPSSSAGRIVRFGTFEVDLRAGELRRNGLRIALHGQPFQVLGVLLEHPGELVSRDELRQRLWSEDTFVDFEHGLNAAVQRLREALGDSATAPRFVETLPRRGYRFVAAVAGAHARSSPHGTALAVLPLANLTGDASQEYFADGMTEALIATLGKVSALGVTSRTSIMQYKGARRPLKEIARELEVDAIVEGSVFRVGDRLQVTVQLIEATTDRHLWSETYVRNLSDVLTLQSDVVRAIVREINVTLSPDESRRLVPQRCVHPDAYADYLEARYHRAQFTGSGPEKALQFYLRALEIDPDLAEAHAGVAELYAVHGVFRLLRHMSWPEAIGRAHAAARRALELDPTLAEAHAARGIVCMEVWDWTGAERDYRHAIELNPSSDVARQWYMQFLRQMGRLDEALEVIRHAAALNPLDLLSKTMVGWPLLNARRYDEAIEQWGQVLDMDPDYALAVYNRGLAYVLMGRHTEGLAAARKALSLMGEDPHARVLLCVALAASGHRSDALGVLDVLEGLIARGEADLLNVVWPHIMLGQQEQALDVLERSFAVRSPFLPNLTSEPVCDALRMHPRFAALRKGMGLV